MFVISPFYKYLKNIIKVFIILFNKKILVLYIQYINLLGI